MHEHFRERLETLANKTHAVVQTIWFYVDFRLVELPRRLAHHYRWRINHRYIEMALYITYINTWQFNWEHEWCNYHLRVWTQGTSLLIAMPNNTANLSTDLSTALRIHCEIWTLFERVVYCGVANFMSTIHSYVNSIYSVLAFTTLTYTHTLQIILGRWNFICCKSA